MEVALQFLWSVTQLDPELMLSPPPFFFKLSPLWPKGVGEGSCWNWKTGQLSSHQPAKFLSSKICGQKYRLPCCVLKHYLQRDSGNKPCDGCLHQSWIMPAILKRQTPTTILSLLVFTAFPQHGARIRSKGRSWEERRRSQAVFPSYCSLPRLLWFKKRMNRKESRNSA